jgi:hypothetical protein
MTGSEVAGCVMWAVILSPWAVSKFKNRRKPVSRNDNKAWEQDYPWPEVFEEDDI